MRKMPDRAPQTQPHCYTSRVLTRMGPYQNTRQASPALYHAMSNGRLHEETHGTGLAILRH